MSLLVPLHSEWLADGEPGRVPLACLHGFTGDTGTWGNMRQQLDPTRPVLALDLVGHGQSSAPDDPAAFTMPAVVASVAATIRSAGVGRAHWLGYSMGGRVALHLALAEPALVATLTLVGASPGIADPAARAERVRADEALADDILSGGIAAFVDRWMANPLFATQARLGEEHVARMRAQRLRNRPEALAAVLRGMGTGAMAPVVDRLGDIECPVLLVAGALDTGFAAQAEGMAARLPRSEVVIVPDVGHAVQIEAPAALAAAVEGFLRRAEAG